MKASPNRGDRPEMVDRYRVFSFAKGTASRSRNDEGVPLPVTLGAQDEDVANSLHVQPLPPTGHPLTGG